MVARKIVKWPNTTLLKSAIPIEKFDMTIVDLASDLCDTMKVHHGAGLASSQIGESAAGCVLDVSYVPSLPADPNIINVIFFGNPSIEPLSGKDYQWKEACLSVDGIVAKVKRYSKIRLHYRNTLGEPLEAVLEGSEAASVQHEVDHLLGKLFIHRLEGITKSIVTRKLRKISLKQRAVQKAENSRNSYKKKRNQKKRRK